jgi:hypothetical protein
MGCQACQADILEFLDLGKIPPCDFLTSEELKTEVYYPMSLHYCPGCGLVQLGEVIDKETLFTPKTGYHHIVSLSSSFKKHLEGLAAKTTERFNLNSNSLVVEIGSNDGTLLEAYRNLGINAIGVDPTDVTKIAIDKGLTTLTEWFNELTAEKIKKEYGKAKVILATNTFAHVSEVHSITRGIEKLLSGDGIFITENHYLLNMIEELQYDFIYHEHHREYSVRSLNNLLNQKGMEIFDVERIPTHAGSIRSFAGKTGAHEINNSVKNLLKEEESCGLNNFETYKEFSRKVVEHIQEFPKMLQSLRKEGKTIMGLTGSARAVTLLNACKIGPEILNAITEIGESKIGKFSPGTHIPVVNQNVLFGENAPDYGLLLSWHLADELIPRFREKGFKGKFIVPLPKPYIIG